MNVPISSPSTRYSILLSFFSLMCPLCLNLFMWRTSISGTYHKLKVFSAQTYLTLVAIPLVVFFQHFGLHETVQTVLQSHVLFNRFFLNFFNSVELVNEFVDVSEPACEDNSDMKISLLLELFDSHLPVVFQTTASTAFFSTKLTRFC